MLEGRGLGFGRFGLVDVVAAEAAVVTLMIGGWEERARRRLGVGGSGQVGTDQNALGLGG